MHLWQVAQEASLVCMTAKLTTRRRSQAIGISINKILLGQHIYSDKECISKLKGHGIKFLDWLTWYSRVQWRHYLCWCHNPIYTTICKSSWITPPPPLEKIEANLHFEQEASEASVLVLRLCTRLPHRWQHILLYEVYLRSLLQGTGHYMSGIGTPQFQNDADCSW